MLFYKKTKELIKIFEVIGHNVNKKDYEENENILLIKKDDKIFFENKKDKIDLECYLYSNTNEDFKINLNFKKIYKILKTINENKIICFNIINKNLLISYDNVQYTIEYRCSISMMKIVVK
jgi:DNA polymerase III sliding clamp (beta) subunit (PCNA family)